MAEILKLEPIMEEQKKLKAEDLKTITDYLNSFSIDDGETDIITQILLQPDEVFEAIAPVLLQEFEKVFNIPENKIEMLRALNAGNLSVEDLRQSYDSIFDEIDSLGESLSEAKRNFLKSIVKTSYAAVSSIEGISRKIVATPIALENESSIPKYMTDGAAAVDLCATEEYTIGPGERVLVGTGIKMAIPAGYAALVQPRSGLSAKSSLRVANTPGLIDSDYRGEIKVILENIEPKIKDFDVTDDGRVTSLSYGQSYTIGKGERIAQLRLVEVPKFAFYEVNNLDVFTTERGEGGFGSTGSNETKN